MAVPVFFSREDFYGRLLPGYAAIILAISYFDFINISEISSTILFLVAGPVVGYILCSITSFVGSIITSIGQEYDYKKYRKDYAKIRFRATERQINELDNTLSTYQFCISTGFIFIVLSLIKIVEIFYYIDIYPILVFAIGLLLILIAKYELEDYHYTFWELHSELINDKKEK